MKRFRLSPKLIVLFLFAVLSTISVHSQDATKSSEINWMKFNDGVVRAQNDNKTVLIHFYTNWCTWCKEMDKKVFANEKVSSYVNENFVAIKCNAEDEESITFNSKELTIRELSYALAVTSYPTTLFLTSDCKPITKLPGYIPASLYLDVIEYINLGAYKNMKFEEWQKKKVK